jgi:WD40 repeat protein
MKIAALSGLTVAIIVSAVEGGGGSPVKKHAPVRNGAQLYITLPHRPWSLSYSPRGRYLYIRTGQRDYVFDVQRRKRYEVPGTDDFHEVDISPDDSTLAVSSYTPRTIILLRISDMAVTKTLRPKEEVRSLVFSPDGKQLAWTGFESDAPNVATRPWFAAYDLANGKLRRLDKWAGYLNRHLRSGETIWRVSVHDWRPGIGVFLQVGINGPRDQNGGYYSTSCWCWVDTTSDRLVSVPFRQIYPVDVLSDGSYIHYTDTLDVTGRTDTVGVTHRKASGKPSVGFSHKGFLTSGHDEGLGIASAQSRQLVAAYGADSADGGQRKHRWRATIWLVDTDRRSRHVYFRKTVRADEPSLQVALTPDGKYIAYAGFGNGSENRITIRRIQ